MLAVALRIAAATTTDLTLTLPILSSGAERWLSG